MLLTAASGRGLLDVPCLAVAGTTKSTLQEKVSLRRLQMGERKGDELGERSRVRAALSLGPVQVKALEGVVLAACNEEVT